MDFLVLVDVKITVHMPITVEANDAEEAAELARTMAMAKFEGDHPDIANTATSVKPVVKK